MLRDSRLNEENRQAAISKMESGTLDVLIIGGGITGVGAALDAVSRGLSVGLLEQVDLASGTSSKSSKLIHGGLRYLEQLDFRLVREALRERGLLLKQIAPHLVTPVPFLLPLRHHIWERAYLGAGVALYDRLGGGRQLPAARHLSRRSVGRLAPALDADTYVGGIQFWDAQVDDARYVTFVARTAAAHGAAIATRIRATEFIVESGRVKGVRAEDTESGKELTIRAQHVATATGVWTGRLLPDDVVSAVTVRPSKGAHIVLPGSALDLHTGVVARTATGLLFVIPWQGQWLVGDTDTEWTSSPGDAVATAADVKTLLDRLNSQLRTPVDTSETVGVFAGLRPLVAASPHVDTVKLSREHAVESPLPGLSAISGGKYTTYRVMASQLIDTVVRDLGLTGRPSSTAAVPLIGAAGFANMWRDRRQLAHRWDMPVDRLERLLRRYGTCITDLLGMMKERPSLGEEIPGSAGALAAEVVYACTHEGARHLDDVIDRRTRVAIQTADRGEACIEAVLTLMRETLCWTTDVTDAERGRYQRLASIERQAVHSVGSEQIAST